MKKKYFLLIVAFVAAVVVVALLPKSSKKAGAAGGWGGKSGGQTSTVFRVTSVLSERKSLQSYLEVNGDVEAEDTVDVYPDISGKLVSQSAHLGSKVSKGEVIAQIDPSTPGATYALSPVYAPISGTITSIPQSVGATVSTSTSVAIIGDIGKLQVSVKIPERDIASLKVGLKANVSFEAYPGVTFSATVFRVSPLVDSTSRTKEVYLAFDKEDDRINAGMFAKVKLFTTVTSNAVTVPDEAIVTNYDKQYVYVVNDDSTVTRAEVVKGVTVDGVTQLLSGLDEGKRIAFEGVSVLSDGVSVKDISQKSAASDAQPSAAASADVSASGKKWSGSADSSNQKAGGNE